MAVKCFLIFFLFWIRSSFNCFNTLFSIFFLLLPVCRVVGGVLLKKKRSFDPSSLFVTETTVEMHSESCRPI